jgi:Dna[CI] antecedent, DciA
VTQNKDFCTVSPCQSEAWSVAAVQKSKSLSELLAGGGKRLSLLKERSAERSGVLSQVRDALPARLAHAVVSAGIDQGRLTVGVVGAVWASRLRYSTDIIRKRVSKAAGLEILAVRIRVVPPPSAVA